MVTICLCLNLMHSELWLSSLNLTFSIFALSKAKTVVPPVKISRATRGNSEIRQHENEEQKKSKLRRFFKRSNSISYSTLSDAVKHNAFAYTAADVLPLNCSSLSTQF
uniref:Uncharacterized protein n=1 Tax=Meloidogyne enterolobii TaxID=390850 RepID=A0A6V7WGK2_MELEN|nr:unnamed protein product [Meloidogyne enterolobii]